jgi:hypothetical protein
MSKQHFFCRLIPPRPTFPRDITPDEKHLMQEHARYTHEGFVAGKVLIYGPVRERGGTFGMAVFEASDEAEVRQFLENDPTVKAGLNRFEISPMMVGGARGKQPTEGS